MNDTSAATTAFFRIEDRSGTETLLPGPRAASSWGGHGQIRGTAISGVLARAAERAAGAVDDAHRFRPGRWTLDLFRPALVAPAVTTATVIRRGRRLRLVDAELTQDGAIVARASLLLLAVDGERPTGQVWDAGLAETPVVADVRPETTESTLYFSEDAGWTGSPAVHQNAGRKMLWFLPATLISGEVPSAFQRMAVAADSSNLVANWGTAGLEFINADLTLSIARLPSDDDGIGLRAEGRRESDGIALGRAMMFDREGPVGAVLLTSIVNSAHTVDPRSFGVRRA